MRYVLRNICLGLLLLTTGGVFAETDSTDGEGDTLTLPQDQEPVNRAPSYSYSRYLKDSLELVQVHDSIARVWKLRDSMQELAAPKEQFPRNENTEYLKNKRKPRFFTLMFFVLVVLFVLKRLFFGSWLNVEFWASLRRVIFKEWMNEMLTLFSFYNVYSKSLSLLTASVFTGYLLYRLDWMLTPEIALHGLGIIFIFFLWTFVKYMLGLFLSYVFEQETLIKYHFSVNQIIDNLAFIPWLLSFLLSYFLYGSIATEWILLIGVGGIVLARLVGFIYFTAWALFDTHTKKLFVFFYLCTLEIIPVAILIRYIAISYP